MDRHVQDKIVILEEGNLPHPRFPACDMFISWAALNRRHTLSDIYAQGAERKRRRMADEEAWEGAVTALQAYERPLKIVSSFKYPVNLLIAIDED